MDPGLSFALGVLIALAISLLIVLWRLPYLRHDALSEYREALAREAEVGARQRLLEERTRFEAALDATRGDLSQLEERIRVREEAHDRRVERGEEREREVKAREVALIAGEAACDARGIELEHALQKQLRELERISGMRREEAEHLLLERVEQACRAEAEEVMARAEAEMRSGLQGRARDLLLTAMERLAPELARSTLVSVVPLVDDELKGALVGREGRAARAFENATGVDLLIDDTPGVVVLSAFEPVRREIARRALLRLLDGGSFIPERIEQVVEEVRQEMEEVVRETGAAAAQEVQIQDLHPRLLTLLGRLEYRSIEGRSVLRHAQETAQLAGALASELDLDPALARRCGLLYPIGRAVEHDAEGGVAALGADFARRCEEEPAVVNAIAAQGGQVPATSAYAPLVEIAAAAVAARPGARDPMLDAAIRRREELEQLAMRHEGVRRCYAMQAGRVLRVLVDPQEVSEKASARLARDIARVIEQTHDGAGEVRVTVIRETEVSEAAL